MALSVAVLALALAAVSTAVAIRALGQDSQPNASGGPAAGSGAISAPSGPGGGSDVRTTPPAPPPDPNATAPPPLDAHTVYDVHYTKQALTLTADCSDSMYADLDEPRGNVSSDGADIRLLGACNSTSPARFELGDSVDASASGAADMDPRDCADKIRTAPVGDSAIPVRKGLAICLTTSYRAARARGDKWRLVLVIVTGVSADGSVGLEVSAWDAPT